MTPAGKGWVCKSCGAEYGTEIPLGPEEGKDALPER